MALQQLVSDIEWPFLPNPIGSPFNPATAVTVAASQFVAWAFCARQAMTISHVAWQTGAITVAPTAITSIESVDASTGYLSGLWPSSGASSPVAVPANTLTTHALGASAVIAAGDIFAVKIAHGGTGTSFVVQHSANLQFSSTIPYRITNVTGSDVKIGLSNSLPIMAVGNSASTFYHVRGMVPSTSFAAPNAFNNTTNFARGAKFRVPFKCRCVGLWNHFNGTVGDFNIVLLDGSSASTSPELGSSLTFFEGDKSSASNAAKTILYFDNPVVLFPGTDYRAVIEPTTTANTNVMTVAAGADFLRPFIGVEDFVYTTRVSGNWTDNATATPLMGLFIDQLDDGTRVIGG